MEQLPVLPLHLRPGRLQSCALRAPHLHACDTLGVRHAQRPHLSLQALKQPLCQREFGSHPHEFGLARGMLKTGKNSVEKVSPCRTTTAVRVQEEGRVSLEVRQQQA